MASKQSTNGEDKMGRSKQRNWFIRYCCCCCTCCCAEDDGHRPLLHSPSKELTPSAGTVRAATKDVNDAVEGEETQQVEIIVADVEENEGEKTPDIESYAEREKDQEQEQQKTAAVDLEPTERARVESGTFVRGSSKRASWRLVPSVTQQVKEAMATEAQVTEESGGEGNKEIPQTELTTEEMSFITDDRQEPTKDDKRPSRDVILIAQDLEEDDANLEESVTMTFAIGSRGNQVVASNGDIIVGNDGQQVGQGVELAG